MSERKMIEWSAEQLKIWLSFAKPTWPTTCLKDSSPPSLEAAQRFLEGNVESVANRMLIDGQPMQILVDEDGIGKDLAINPAASHLCQGTLVGKALVLIGKARWE